MYKGKLASLNDLTRRRQMSSRLRTASQYKKLGDFFIMASFQCSNDGNFLARHLVA